MKQPWFSIRSRLRSFGFAIAGLRVMFRTQFHAWVHLTATLAVIVAALMLSVSRMDWCLLILAIGLVWIGEAANTCVELLVDLVSPEYNELAGKAKDVAAAAVLLASITAAVVGAIVFVPHCL